jgi:hypothetical protein
MPGDLREHCTQASRNAVCAPTCFRCGADRILIAATVQQPVSRFLSAAGIK